MPLLSPSQIHEVLRREGQAEPQSAKSPSKDKLAKLLADANLSPEECLENLSSLMRSAEHDTIRLGAVKTALELNQLIEKDGARANFTVNIQINNHIDGEPDLPLHAINPILIPRGATTL